MTPRLLTISDAATYCSIGESTYRDWVRRGLVPGCISGVRRIDRVALDQALDKMAGHTDGNTMSTFEEWDTAN